MQADDKQYLHPDVKPFEPHLSKSLKRQERIVPPVLTFLWAFLFLVAGRGLWELHKAEQPILWLVAWAAFLAGAITFGVHRNQMWKKAKKVQGRRTD